MNGEDCAGGFAAEDVVGFDDHGADAAVGAGVDVGSEGREVGQLGVESLGIAREVGGWYSTRTFLCS